MQNIRRRNIHNVDVGPPHNFAPIRRRLRPSPLRGHRIPLGFIAPTQHFQLKLVRHIKKMPHLPKGIGMRFGDEARANHRNIKLLLRDGH